MANHQEILRVIEQEHLAQLLNILSRVDFTEIAEDQGHKIFAQYIQWEYNIAFNLFWKKIFDNTHKISCPLRIYKNYETKSEVLCRLFKLIEGCFSRYFSLNNSDSVLELGSPIACFIMVVSESMFIDIFKTYGYRYSTTNYTKRPKDSLMSNDRAFITCLRRLDNPVLDSAFLKEVPQLIPTIQSLQYATNKLYTTACNLSAQSNDFKKEYWLTYVESLRADLEFKKENWTIGQADGERLIIQGKPDSQKKKHPGRHKVVKNDLLWKVQKNSISLIHPA